MRSHSVLAGAKRLLDYCLERDPQRLPVDRLERRAPHSIAGQAERLLVGIARDLAPDFTPAVTGEARWVGADEPPLVVEEVRDARIDVFAQNSLLRITRDPASGTDARDMVAAVRSGRLLGIYKEDQLVPAKRAQKLGTWWGTIIPKGEDSTVFLDPDDLRNGVPLIMFRHGVRSDKARIDRALRKSWTDFKAFEAAKVNPALRVDVNLPGCETGESTVAGIDIVGQELPTALRGLVPTGLCSLKLPSPAKPKPKPAAGSKTLTIVLQMSFSLASKPGGERFEARKIKDALVRVEGTTLKAVTDKDGSVTFPASELIGNGRVLTIAPNDPLQVSLAPAGTVHGVTRPGGTRPDFMFRPFQVTVDVTASGFGASPTVNAFPVPGVPPHALLFGRTATKLILDWKPDWMKTENRTAVATKRNDFLVIHQTGTIERMGNHINTFNAKIPRKDKAGNLVKDAAGNVIKDKGSSAHYLVDVDGHALKLVHESDAAHHTGPAFFDGQNGLNSQSIGIEIVHCDETDKTCGLGPHDFTDAQYTTVLRLTTEIRTQFGISRQHVVGHGEIRTQDDAKTKTVNRALSTKRNTDPGVRFEWERLEAVGLARARRSGPIPADVHGLKPKQVATLSKTPKDVDLSAIKEDLKTIGYSIHPKDSVTVTKTFDEALTNAVEAFQARYFAGTRRVAFTGKRGEIDFETALAIQEVAADTGA